VTLTSSHHHRTIHSISDPSLFLFFTTIISIVFHLMCRRIHRVSTAWVNHHLTVTLVKKFHRRKCNRRAINKFFQSQDYYHRLGKSVGIVFTLSFRNKKPHLFIRRIKQEVDTDIDSSYNDIDTDSESESSFNPVASAC
jgi:hypothetical protein